MCNLLMSCWCHFGPEENISTIIGWISMIFGADIDVCFRMNFDNSGESLTSSCAIIILIGKCLQTNMVKKKKKMATKVNYLYLCLPFNNASTQFCFQLVLFVLLLLLSYIVIVILFCILVL